MVERRSHIGSNNPRWSGDRVEISCQTCSSTIFVSPLRAKSQKYCSNNCRWEALRGKPRKRGRESSSYRGGTNIYPRLAGLDKNSSCTWCGWQRNLMVHHRDHDRHNGEPDNLVIICRSCHQRHHKVGSWLPGYGSKDHSTAKVRPGQPGTPEWPGP